MFRTREIEANGLSFHVVEAGEPGRPLLLLLHGFPEYSGAWEEVMARLQDRFHLVAPDQRGYGLSSKPYAVTDYATGKLAADAAAILTAFAPHARAVVGHDWGASVAYALAIARPELMDKLVILNGAHPIPFQRALAAGGDQSRASQYIDWLRAEGSEDRLSANGFAKMRRLFAEGIDLSWLSGPRLEAYLEAWGQPGAMRGMVNWYRATPLRVADPGAPIPEEKLVPFNPDRLRIRPPHLLIWGQGDKALLPAATEGLEALCDDLTRVEIADADHWICHQKPDEVCRLIADFVG